jgi:hypothetical protein
LPGHVLSMEGLDVFKELISIDGSVAPTMVAVLKRF